MGGVAIVLIELDILLFITSNPSILGWILDKIGW